jgi:hypothetical protein
MRTAVSFWRWSDQLVAQYEDSLQALDAPSLVARSNLFLRIALSCSSTHFRLTILTHDSGGLDGEAAMVQQSSAVGS